MKNDYFTAKSAIQNMGYVHHNQGDLKGAILGYQKTLDVGHLSTAERAQIQCRLDELCAQLVLMRMEE